MCALQRAFFMRTGRVIQRVERDNDKRCGFVLHLRDMTSSQSTSLIALTPDFETRRTAVAVGKVLSVDAQSSTELSSWAAELQTSNSGTASNQPTALRLVGWLDRYLEAGDVDARLELRKLLVDCLPAWRDANVGELILPFASAGSATSDDDRAHRLVDFFTNLRFEFGMAAVRIHVSLAEHGYPATPRELRRLIDEANSPWVVASAPPLDGTCPLPAGFFQLLGHRIASLCFRDSEQVRQTLTSGGSTKADGVNPMQFVCERNHRPLIIIEDGEPSAELLQQLSQIETVYAQSAKIDRQATAS